MTSTLDAIGFEIDDLINKGRHGIDARIAGADKSHLLALLGKLDGVADAVFLATSGKRCSVWSCFKSATRSR